MHVPVLPPCPHAWHWHDCHRLITFDVDTLYELHYQMITLVGDALFWELLCGGSEMGQRGVRSRRVCRRRRRGIDRWSGRSSFPHSGVLLIGRICQASHGTLLNPACLVRLLCQRRVTLRATPVHPTPCAGQGVLQQAEAQLRRLPASRDL